MKNLLDRLEDDIRDGLANNAEPYPSGTESVLEALKTNYSWLNLTIGQVHSLIMFSDIPWVKVTDRTFQFGENIIKDEK